MNQYFELSKFLIIISSLILISYIDTKYKIIPDKLLIFLIMPGIILNLLIGDISIKYMILGFLMGGGSLFLISFIFNGGIGGGDIKLMAVMGLYIGLKSTVNALTISFILSGFVSLLLILFKVKSYKDSMVFGPYLSVGIFLSLLMN